MQQALDILSIAQRHPVMQEQLDLLLEKEQMIPGSVQYNIRRFRKHPQTSIEDTGMVVYHFKKNESVENFLELRFCITGNTYCRKKHTECDFCKFNDSKKCVEKIESIDVVSFKFTPTHLSQFVKGIKQTNFSEDILNFRHTSSFSKILPLCGRTRLVLEALLNHSYTDSLENIYINAQTQMLLLYSMECMIGDKEDSFACKFLANEADREKILKAREILLQHISEPLTIKKLSRKVAINECYLKKGFKEMFGTTIFDFFQSQRMEHAKYLLYEKGLSVTDVSLLLGYSSISHFSTAFKKQTGLKPCELLFH
ncbi:MAG: helix-turn-helix transcriptional regulator [Chitinophagaceae bacterium]|nr:helix-turn-helix transcriptional regulator [Chitinophagaceae bacterium]